MPSSLAPAMAGGYSALSPAHVGGRRRGRTAKKLRLVKKATVRRMLKKHGLKMRGGVDDAAAPPPPVDPAKPATGGRRRSRRHSRRHRMFGMGMY
jgi:hypothetical protein